MSKRSRPEERIGESCQRETGPPQSSVRNTSHGLNLILEYDEDSEDEAKETHWQSQSEEQVYNKPTKVKRLEVPAEIALMFNQVTDDDRKAGESSDHEGRKRSFAHVRGNWASFVYIPISAGTDFTTVELMQNLVKSTLEFKDIPLHLNSDVHLSLSKTIPFRHHWLDPFKLELKNRLNNFKSFFIVFDQFGVYVNEEKTRTFVGIKVHSSESLDDLVQICDECLKEYRLECYYSEPSFHFSLGWLLGDQFDEVTKLLPLLNEKWRSLLEENQSLLTLNVSSVEFKYGDRVSAFNLDS